MSTPINANSIRVGNILDHEKGLWLVMKTMHTQPGKGGAYMQVEMKNIKTGTKTNIRFRSSETVSKASLEEKKFQVLYILDGVISVMNLENYDQMDLSTKLINEEHLPFIAENIQISVDFYEDEAVIIRLPSTVVARIKECEAVIKGQTASSSYKPAILENGVRIMVPPFLNAGDSIVVKIETMEYVERVK